MLGKAPPQAIRRIFFTKKINFLFLFKRLIYIFALLANDVVKKSSIKDVAKLAGVSIASVSYVLNNTPNKSIKEETVARILEAAKELNYTPNKIARSLKTQKSYTIGLIVADIANPYFSQLARFIEDEAEKQGYTLIIGSSDESDAKFARLLTLFRDRMVDGLIIAPVEGDKTAVELAALKNIPFVLIDRTVPGFDAPAVLINNREISRKTAQYLIDSGKKNIALVSYNTGITSLSERMEGYIDALNANGIVVNRSFILSIDEKRMDDDMDERLTSLFASADKPDALFFITNKLSVSGLRWLIENNIKVPADVAVVAFDQTDAYKLFPVPVTFIKQPLPAIASAVMGLLLERIDDTDAPTKVRELEARLKIKASSM